MAGEQFRLAPPLIMEKVTSTQIFFGTRCFDPLLWIWRKRKQSFRNSPDKGSLYCSRLRSAADLPKTLEDFWLPTANTFNPRDDIPHVSRISCYRRLRGASTVTVNVPAACQSSRLLRIGWIFMFGYFILAGISLSHRQKCREADS